MNGGVSFGVLDNAVHADVHDIQWNPIDNVIYLACDGGMYKSTDQGLNWFSCFNGIQASQFYHMTSVDGDNNIIMAGAQDNGSDKISGINTAVQVNGADGEDCLVDWSDSCDRDSGVRHQEDPGLVLG